MIEFMYHFLIISILWSVSLYAESNTSLLTGIARDTIIADLYQHKPPNPQFLTTQYPFLQKDGATFVTLNKVNRLRGCIGSLQPFRPLVDDIISNSRSAAFSDPRFRKLRRDELSGLDVEVSLLTKPQETSYANVAELKKEIVTGEDGIVLKLGEKRAIYLPQVWEQLPTFHLFFASLCKKAGLSDDCLKYHPEIERYHVKKYSEDDLTTRPMGNVGRFYDASCKVLTRQFKTFESRYGREKKSEEYHVPRAMIVPHAGYVYSGYTAFHAYRAALQSRAKRIILVGPSHHNAFKGVSIATYEAFQTPCGKIRSDVPYVQMLQKKYELKMIKKVHYQEHSTEAQLPFINHYLPQMKVVELVYGDISSQGLSAMMEVLLEDPDNLLIVSSDLSHFHRQQEAYQHDFICLSAIESVAPHHLNKGCEACGFRGIEALLLSVKRLKMQSKLLDYRTSADAFGERENIVGYTSAIFW